jgi:outer membrane protein assembly factor BamA
VNYDIYGNGVVSGLKLPLKQTGQAFFAEFLRRVGWKFLAGPRLLTGNSFLTVRPNNNINFPIPPDLGIHTTLTAIGARLTRDTSPNRFYPTSGTYFNFTADFYSQSLSSKYSFQSYSTTFDKYWSLSNHQVLAYNAYFCATGGKPPFYGNCIFGTNNELRGYVAGQYFATRSRHNWSIVSSCRSDLAWSRSAVLAKSSPEAVSCRGNKNSYPTAAVA